MTCGDEVLGQFLVSRILSADALHLRHALPGVQTTALPPVRPINARQFGKKSGPTTRTFLSGGMSTAGGGVWLVKASGATGDCGLSRGSGNQGIFHVGGRHRSGAGLLDAPIIALEIACLEVGAVTVGEGRRQLLVRLSGFHRDHLLGLEGGIVEPEDGGLAALADVAALIDRLLVVAGTYRNCERGTGKK